MEDMMDGFCYFVLLCFLWVFYENCFFYVFLLFVFFERRKERFDNWLFDFVIRLMDVVRNCFDVNFEKCDFKLNIDLFCLYIL
jgi:hypothetical protein